ncbi:putative Swr1p complex component (Swc5) [Aspergillus undulatus]|uniref:putative Swr1p complex component (Swc5) n=1 Tax=Aspergillus undulatus TaxID=1810928 RepID=UPI003CCCD2D9
MTNADIDLDNEQDDSEDDEDFTLDQAADDDDAELSSSGDEAETGTETAAKKRKTKGEKGDAEGEDGELDSGDEAMIRKAKDRKKRKKGGKKGDDDEEDLDIDDEEGGTGGFVRTRAMKMKIQEERRPLAIIDGATVDVDALWAQMNAPDSTAGLALSQDTQQQKADEAPPNDIEMRDQENTAQPNNASEKPLTKTPHLGEMIKIKRTYKFAGEYITEEKVVPRDSAEAKLFLAGAQQDGEIVPATDDDLAITNGDNNNNNNNSKQDHIIRLRRPLRKISRFDPNPTGSIKKSWEKQPLAPEAGQEENANARGPKINTVEKSRLDWAAYVDRAGISDELRVHSKAKEGFLGRMDFLDRVEATKEEERRNARLKGV